MLRVSATSVSTRLRLAAPPIAWPPVSLTEARLLFSVCAIAYLAIAAYLVFGLGLVIGDGWSRVGNATYVLLSRDPHLAAIGFVWNPLPSLLVLPLIPFAAIWPSLVHAGFAANIISAIAMAAAVVQLRGIVADAGIARLPRLAMVAAMAINPMIVYYAANGMSEALFVLILLVAVRCLAAWLREDSLSALVLCGLALGLAYLVRYEAVAASGVVIAVVAAVSAARATPGRRRAQALADAIVVGSPFAATFVIWAMTSWIIVGSPFETFTSVYGNSSQVELMAPWIRLATSQGTGQAPWYFIRQVLGLEPGLALLVPFALVIAIRRREWMGLASLVLAAVLAFAGVAFVSGHSFGWLRFSITAIPLAIVLVALGSSLGTSARARGTVRMLAAVAVVWAGVATTTWTMLEPTLGQEEARQLGPYLVGAVGGPTTVPPESQSYRLGGEVARAIDALGLPSGSVLVDVATGFPIVLQSQRPTQFVITPDRDFPAILADPLAFRVRYLLVPDDRYLGTLDALNRHYPGLYEDGAGIGKLVAAFESASFSWRLYLVLEQ